MTDILYVNKEKALINRSITIVIKGRLLEDISVLNSYYDRIKLEEACKKGCVNYGKKWSCPPYSKQFLELGRAYSKGCLLCFSTGMEYYSDIKNKYLAVKAANVTLKSLIEKCARDLESYINGYALLSGSCRLCKPCKCKSKEPCKHPDNMRYSMEAAALNVEKLCFDFLGHELLWYENKKLPKYTSVAVLILYNQNLNLNEVSKTVDKIMIGS